MIKSANYRYYIETEAANTKHLNSEPYKISLSDIDGLELSYLKKLFGQPFSDARFLGVVELENHNYLSSNNFQREIFNISLFETKTDFNDNNDELGFHILNNVIPRLSKEKNNIIEFADVASNMCIQLSKKYNFYDADEDERGLLDI